MFKLMTIGYGITRKNFCMLRALVVNAGGLPPPSPTPGQAIRPIERPGCILQGGGNRSRHWTPIRRRTGGGDFRWCASELPETWMCL